MGRHKAEAEKENIQSKAEKTVDKDASSKSQTNSEVTKSVENDKKDDAEKDAEKTSSSADNVEGETTAESNKESPSVEASSGENEVTTDLNETLEVKRVETSEEALTSPQKSPGMIVPEIVAKRGRGRPRKTAPSQCKIIEPEKIKRGRGRPPKSHLQKALFGKPPGFSASSAAGGNAEKGKVESEQSLAAGMKNEAFADCEEELEGDYGHSTVNGNMGKQNKSRNLPFRKSKRRSIPRINLEDFEDDSDDEPVRKKQSTKPKRFPPSGPKVRYTTASTPKKPRETVQHLTAQVDRLASLVDRLENRINLDGLVDEDTDIETDLEDDVQVLLLQRNFNVENELKRDFKDIVKGYIEELGTESGCLIASTRSYKNSGKFTVYEIWNAEQDQMTFSKESGNKIFSDDTSNMLKTTPVVKTMNIPASWWQKCS